MTPATIGKIRIAELSHTELLGLAAKLRLRGGRCYASIGTIMPGTAADSLADEAEACFAKYREVNYRLGYTK